MNDEDFNLFDDEVEAVEQEIIELEDGRSYSKDEWEHWETLREEAEELVNDGYEADLILNNLNQVFQDNIIENDMKEAYENGIKPEEIGSEAWELYNKNIGKLSIKECIERTDEAIKSINDGFGIERKTTKRAKIKDYFLDGFNSY